MDMPCKIGARMSCKQTQTLRGHKSAPQATLTPQLKLNRSPQPGEHICIKNTGYFCAPPSPGTHRRQVSLAVLLEIDECNISQP